MHASGYSARVSARSVFLKSTTAVKAGGEKRAGSACVWAFSQSVRRLGFLKSMSAMKEDGEERLSW
eukprot:scaffold62906_cov18-Tisochrysis_lutea.AAC.2